MNTASPWIEVRVDSITAGQSDDKPLVIGFNIRPYAAGVRLDVIELLRVGRKFFLELFRDFVRGHGKLYIHASAEQLVVGGSPGGLTDDSDLEKTLAKLLEPRQASPYPIVIWFEPQVLRRSWADFEQDLELAAEDMAMLNELIRAGFFRLFVDDEFADLLVDATDRQSVLRWIERAASHAPHVRVRFDA